MALDPKYRVILNRMGFYAYQQGLIYHHLNQEGGWSGHLKRCRDFIIKGLEYHKPTVVTVLGSGWLLDLPLSEILEKVEKLYLVDIIHPPEVKSQVTNIKKVIVKEDDVTGGLISEVWNNAGRRHFFSKLKTIESIRVPEYQPDFDPGMVISLNIFTQLESMPVRFLEKKAAISEKDFHIFRKEIQQKHLSFLKRHKSVLITDLAEVITGSSGEVLEKVSVLADLPDALIREEWTLHFDVKRSDFYNSTSVYKVAGLIF